MYSEKVQRAGCNRPIHVIRHVLKASCLFAALLFSVFSHGAWQDPLNTPALNSDRAYQDLLLDITRAGNRLIAVGAHGHVIYSDDNGSSWQQGQVPVSSTLTTVYFASEQIGWAAGHDGVILNSKDGGKTWHKQFDGFVANQDIVNSLMQTKAQAEAELAAAEQGTNEAKINAAQMALENADYALSDARYDLESGSTKPFLDLWFYDAKQGFVIGAYGMIFRTEDGGETWLPFNDKLPNPDRLHLNAIVPVGANALTIVGEMGLILRSDNLGKTWVKLDTPYDGSFFGLVAKGNMQLVFGLRGHIFQSQDAGISWTAVSTDNEQALLGATAGKEQIALVGNGGAVVLFNKQGKLEKSIVVEGRKAYASIAGASDGSYILVGEAGVMRLSPNGELNHQNISMVGE